MFQLVIVAILLISSFFGYDYISGTNHSLPSFPKMFSMIDSAAVPNSSIQGNSLFFPTVDGSSNNQPSASGNQDQNNLPNSGSISSPDNNPIPNTNPTGVNNPNVITSTTNSIIQMTESSFGLCGKDQFLYSYDKTDMRTGGDISYFVMNAPNVTAKLILPNGTVIETLKNQNNGCIYKSMPKNIMINAVLSGDFNGTMQFSSGPNPMEIIITCHPHWQQSTMYGQYGNIIQKYNPPIDHPSYCEFTN